MKLYTKRINRSLGGSIVLYIFLIIVAVFMGLPLFLVISNAFKPLEELFLFPPKLVPINPTLQNFKDLFVLMDNSWVPISRYLFNTCLITVTGTAGHVLLASMCAYFIAKKDFPGKNIIFGTIWVSLMFNGAVTTIPNYIIMKNLNMIDTLFALIIPAFGAPLGLYLMKQFMEQIPNALLEAAEIDGAGDFKTFFTIVMPLVKPAWLTAIIFTIQSLWNIGNTVFIYTENLKTLPYALSQIVAGGVARTGVSGVAMLIIMIVPVAVFCVTQSNIIETMASSGMKE